MAAHISCAAVSMLAMSVFSLAPGITNIIVYRGEPVVLTNVSVTETMCYNMQRTELLAFGIIQLIFGAVFLIGALFIVVYGLSGENVEETLVYWLAPTVLYFVALIVILSISGQTLFNLDCTNTTTFWKVLCTTFSMSFVNLIVMITGTFISLRFYYKTYGLNL